MAVEPDLKATSFSAQNAYFFAKLSTIAYMTKTEVEGVMKGDDNQVGLGFDRFHWFQVGSWTTSFEIHGYRVIKPRGVAVRLSTYIVDAKGRMCY